MSDCPKLYLIYYALPMLLASGAGSNMRGGFKHDWQRKLAGTTGAQNPEDGTDKSGAWEVPISNTEFVRHRTELHQYPARSPSYWFRA